jgi:hypothetical protein
MVYTIKKLEFKKLEWRLGCKTCIVYTRLNIIAAIPANEVFISQLIHYYVFPLLGDGILFLSSTLATKVCNHSYSYILNRNSSKLFMLAYNHRRFEYC